MNERSLVRVGACEFVMEVGALVGSSPDGVPVRVKRGSKVDFIDSVSVTCYQVR